MRTTHTRTDILYEAIDLFSSEGYTECTMRALAQRVGIKPASLYYFFESKERLLDEIFQIFMDNDAGYRKPVDDMLERAADMSAEEALQAMLFTYTTSPEFLRMIKILRIAIGHQFENKRAKEVYTHIYRDMALDHRTMLLRGLITRGICDPFDCDVVAYIMTSYSMMLTMSNHDMPIEEFALHYNDCIGRMAKTIAPLIKKRAR